MVCTNVIAIDCCSVICSIEKHRNNRSECKLIRVGDGSKFKLFRLTAAWWTLANNFFIATITKLRFGLLTAKNFAKLDFYRNFFRVSLNTHIKLGIKNWTNCERVYVRSSARLKFDWGWIVRKLPFVSNGLNKLALYIKLREFST